MLEPADSASPGEGSRVYGRIEEIRPCAKTWVLALLGLGVWSCYKDSSGCVIVIVGESVGDSA